MATHRCKVLIVGGGVTGTALAFVLSRYTNVGESILIEKNSGVAQVSSHPLNNSQTSHDGGTETNYNLAHALEVKAAAVALRRYVESKKDPALFRKTNRMVLGVGEDEVRLLKKRFEEFRPHYPDLRLVGPDELWEIEPKVMEGRNKSEPVCALVSSDGYAINYQKLAEHFFEDAKVCNPKFSAHFNMKVKSVKREGDSYILETQGDTFIASVIVFAAGAYSLLFAQQLGYGKDLGILSVAGSFYSGGNLLYGKVYRVQIEGMPFAAIHGDPDVLNQKDTRFGPTTKPLPLMERHHYKTFFDYIKLPIVSLRGLWSLLRIISRNEKLLPYFLKNMIFDVPVIGKLMFLREVRPIVPMIRYRDLKLRKGVGGVRPQIVDLKTGTLQMGDATIEGENAIFNTTPSPGASVCLGNAKRDTRKVVRFLGEGFWFDEEGFEAEFSSSKDSKA